MNISQGTFGAGRRKQNEQPTARTLNKPGLYTYLIRTPECGQCLGNKEETKRSKREESHLDKFNVLGMVG